MTAITIAIPSNPAPTEDSTNWRDIGDEKPITQNFDGKSIFAWSVRKEQNRTG
jgi:hypothetical protein